MEGLGRVLNVVPIAAGAAISVKECTGVTFVLTGADTFSLTTALTFGGTYRAGSFFTPAWAPIDHMYDATATNGTALWTRVAQTAADNTGLLTAGHTTVVEISANALPDGYKYLKMSGAAAGLVIAIAHDLEIQRKPQNLLKLGA